MYYNYIPHYVSLKRIRFSGITAFTRELIRIFVRRGTLANLEEFHVDGYDLWSSIKKVLELFIEHCPHQKRIKLFWFLPIRNEIMQTFIRRILAQNLDIDFEIKEYSTET
jgi:hypothetical protein